MCTRFIILSQPIPCLPFLSVFFKIEHTFLRENKRQAKTGMYREFASCSFYVCELFL